MRKSFLILFSFIFLAFKCGPNFEVELLNTSSKDVILEMILEKEALEISRSNPTYPLFKIDSENGVEILSFDTLYSVAKIKIPPGEKFEIESGAGKEPKFTLIKQMVIFGNDTISLNDKNEMKKAFKEVENRSGKFELIIK